MVEQNTATNGTQGQLYVGDNNQHSMRHIGQSTIACPDNVATGAGAIKPRTIESGREECLKPAASHLSQRRQQPPGGDIGLGVTRCEVRAGKTVVTVSGR